MPKQGSDFRTIFRRVVWQGLNWGFKFPFYVRLLLGLIFIVLGFFGFFPILGFWMIPLGALLIGTTIPAAARRIRSWMGRVEAELNLRES